MEQQQIKTLREQVEEALANVRSKEELADFWQRFLSKKGSIPGLMKGLGAVAPEERPTFGKMVNEFKEQVSRRYEEMAAKLEAAELEARNRAESEARNILTYAIQRYASDCTYERTTATIPLPSDELKGRIRGLSSVRVYETADSCAEYSA